MRPVVGDASATRRWGKKTGRTHSAASKCLYSVPLVVCAQQSGSRPRRRQPFDAVQDRWSVRCPLSWSLLTPPTGLCWKALSPVERQVWEDKARQAQAEHRSLYPDWRWTPEANALARKRTPKNADPARRKDKSKAREPEPDDDARVAKIADLVKQGKSGADLATALEQWQAAQQQPPPDPDPGPEPDVDADADAKSSHVPLCSPSDTWPNTAPASSYHHWWPATSPTVTTDGLGYEQDQDYSEVQSLITPVQMPDHHSRHRDDLQWTCNPGRNGICTVITDPLTEYHHFAPPSLVDAHPYFPPDDSISSNPTFTPSTYSSLTGWAGEYGNHYTGSGVCWQGPQRPSSSWGQEQVDTHRKIFNYTDSSLLTPRPANP